MTDIRRYIIDNASHKTTKEMAVDLKLKVHAVWSQCQQLGIKPITNRQRIADYIKANPSATLEAVAKKFGYTVANIRLIAADVRVSLKTHKQALSLSEKKEVKIAKMQEREVKPFSRRVNEYLNETFGAVSFEPRKRIKDVYNQSGSPFGLADQLRGLKIK